MPNIASPLSFSPDSKRKRRRGKREREKESEREKEGKEELPVTCSFIIMSDFEFPVLDFNYVALIDWFKTYLNY